MLERRIENTGRQASEAVEAVGGTVFAADRLVSADAVRVAGGNHIEAHLCELLHKLGVFGVGIVRTLRPGVKKRQTAAHSARFHLAQGLRRTVTRRWFDAGRATGRGARKISARRPTADAHMLGLANADGRSFAERASEPASRELLANAGKSALRAAAPVIVEMIVCQPDNGNSERPEIVEARGLGGEAIAERSFHSRRDLPDADRA